MSQADSDLESLESADLTEQQQLPDDVLEALGLGRLTDLQFLGSGATSSVFSAHDSRLDKRVAIKYLKHADANRLINFQTEAKLASKLNHDNLVRILNFGVTKKNHAFLIMDFVDGKSLDTILEEHFRVPKELAITLLMQVCDGLAHSHSKKIAHRDLKTANILVQEYGTKKVRSIVVDFGLAQQRESTGQNTGKNSGKIKGSPLFISPEQAQGQHGDERSDIYSLGCVAFYLLTGSLPFESDEMFDLLRMHIETPAQKIDKVAPELEFSPTLTNCIARMLEKNPADRFQTIQEVHDMLAKSTMRAVPEKSSRVVPKRLRRGWIKLFLMVLLIVLLFLIVAVALLTNGSKRGQAHRHPTKKVIVESADERFKRIFKYDTGTFLSHFNRKQICPRVDNGVVIDEDLECLAQVPLSIPDINLSFTNITGAGLRYLKSIPNLKLDLSKTAMTSEGFEAIGSLKNLRALSLVGAKIKKKPSGKLLEISEPEILEVAQSGQIVELNLDLCKSVDDSCLEAVNTLPLQGLTARDAGDITDEGLIALSKCKSLTLLHLDDAKITDKGVDAVSKLGTLEDFRANRSRLLTGKSLRMLVARNPKLKYIGLSFTKTTSKDLHCLEGKDLDFIEIYGVPIGADELKMFGKMQHMKNMYLSNVEDPDGLKYLYGMKDAWRLIFLDSKKLTAESLSKLQEHLPKHTFVSTGENKSIQPEVRDVESMFIEGSSSANKFEGDQPRDSRPESEGLLQ